MKTLSLIRLPILLVATCTMILTATMQPAHAARHSNRSGFTHDFWLYYMAVQHSLKGNNGQITTAAYLDRVNPKATEFIAKFWWKKIQRECVDQPHGQYSTIAATQNIDDVDIMMNVEEEMKYCAYTVLYENWGEINETILNRLQIEHTDNRRAIMTSLAKMGLSYKAVR